MRSLSRSTLRIVSLITLAATSLSVAHAADVTVLAVNAMKEPLLGLVATFEKTSAHKVSVVWGGTEAITKKVSEGAPADIVIVAAPNIDKLIAEGKLVAGSRADIAKVGVGVAVRAGSPKPDISSPQAVRNAVLAARSVSYSSGPSGFYVAELFKTMGIAEQVQEKVKQPPSGGQVAELLARGEVDLGFQQISELQHAKGIDYLGPLPAEIQNITTYSSGLHTASREPDAARAFVQFLTAPPAAHAIKKAGMELGR